MDCLDNSIRFTGRWHVTARRAVATAPGAFFQLAFEGKSAVLHFEMEWMSSPFVHLWVCVDGGAWTETAIDRHLRIHGQGTGNHVVKIVFKSAVEMAHRWYPPLDGRVEFLGYDAKSPGRLPAMPQKTIEFVGDSITEGVLVDEKPGEEVYPGWKGRPYQDDAMASYAWLAAESLGLTPLIMGYGSVGVTKAGCGSVPKASQAYPFCFYDAPVFYEEPDYIVINHGTNDCLSGSEAFLDGYRELLQVIARCNPSARMFVMVPFCGIFRQELGRAVEEFRREGRNPIDLVDTEGWRISAEPVHPGREEHIKLGGLLAEELHRLGVPDLRKDLD